MALAALAVPTQIVTARSAEDVRGLRDAWEELGPADLNADPDVFLAHLETRPEFVRPHVVLAEAAGVPRALLVARLARTRIPVRLGYREVYAPELTGLTVVQGGLLGSAELVFEEATDVLARREADVLRLRSVHVGSELHRLAHAEQPRTLRGRQEARAWRRWRLALPSSLDEILRLQSRRTRSKHRALARKLEAELGRRLTLDVHRDARGAERLIRDAEALSAKTDQRPIGGGFGATPSDARLVELAAKRGWLRAYVVRVDGEPCAFWIGLAYAGVFYVGPTGYDPAFADLRLGRYALLRMLADLCEDEAVDHVDWGVGDDEYKRQFGSESWVEEDLLLFAPTPRGVRINATRTALQAAGEGARRIAGRGFKQRWRSRLARGGTA